MTPRLQLELGHKEKLPLVSHVAKSFNSLMCILSELNLSLTKTMTPRKVPQVVWRVTPEKMEAPSSYWFSAEYKSDNGVANGDVISDTLDAFRSGILSLYAEPKLPAHFTEQALKATKSLCMSSNGDGPVKAVVQEIELPFNKPLSENASRILKGTHFEYSGVEGTLVGIRMPKPETVVLSVKPEGRHMMACKIPSSNADLIDLSISLLGRQVLVWGKKKINFIDRPMDIVEVYTLKELRTDLPPVDFHRLPQWDYGESSVDFIRRGRGHS